MKKNELYPLAVAAASEMIREGRVSARLKRGVSEEAEALLDAGATHAEINRILQKAAKDAAAIEEHLGRYPDDLIKVHSGGWRTATAADLAGDGVRRGKAGAGKRTRRRSRKKRTLH